MFTEVPLLGPRASPVVAELPLPDVPTRLKPVGLGVNGSTDVQTHPLPHVASRAGFAGGRVLWRILGGNTKISLLPLDSTSGGVVLRVPGRIIPECVAVTLIGDDEVLVDFVAESGLLYTALVGRKQLYHGEPFLEQGWRVMKRPHVFDADYPRLIVAASPNLLLAALSNGSLVRFDRDSPLGQITTTTFKDISAPHGLAAWVKQGADRVPGHPQLSLRSIVGAAVSGDFVVTISVKNDIRVWSLTTNECITVAERKGALRLIPSRYVAAHTANQVVVAAPEGFEIWDLSTLSVVSTRPYPRHVAGWFLVDICSHDGELVVAYKNNLSGRVYIGNKEVVSYDMGDILRVPDAANLESAMFTFESYSEAALRAALIDLGLGTSTIRADVEKAVQYAACSSGTGERLEWLRLDQRCRDIETQGSELLAVSPEKDGVLWTVRAAHLSVVCRGGPPDSPLLDVLETLQSMLSPTATSPENTLADQPAVYLLPDETDLVAEQLQRSLDAASLQMLRRKVEEVDVEALLSSYLDEFRNGTQEPELNAQHLGFGPGEVGSEALARFVSLQATRTAPKLRTLSYFVVLALLEGWLADGLTAYQRVRDELRVTRTVSALQWAGILDSGVEALPSAKGLGHSAVTAAWRQLDLWGPDGITLYIRSCEASPSIATELGRDLLHTPAAVLARGIGEREPRLVASVAPVLASETSIELVTLGLDFSGKGLAHYYLRASEVLGSVELARLAVDASTEWPAAKHLLDLALKEGDLDAAYFAITALNLHGAPTDVIQNAIAEFINDAASAGATEAAEVIRDLPFIGLASQVAHVLGSRTYFGGMPSYKLLYTWHVTREDYVGAARAVYGHIQNVRSQLADGGSADLQADLFDLYTIALNALKLERCADNQWILAGANVVTFDDMRREYKSLVDDITAIL